MEVDFSTFGINWDGPVLDEEDTVVIPEVSLDLTDDQRQTLPIVRVQKQNWNGLLHILNVNNLFMNFKSQLADPIDVNLIGAE